MQIDDLKSSGLKATVPRLKILEVFQRGVQRHMTAEDVFRHLYPVDRGHRVGHGLPGTHPV